MANSKALPPFSDRCHVQLLPGTAAHAADTACTLRLMHSPRPATLPAGITARTGERALWVLILLLLVLAGCKVGRHSSEAERAKPTKNASTIADVKEVTNG